MVIGECKREEERKNKGDKGNQPSGLADRDTRHENRNEPQPHYVSRTSPDRAAGNFNTTNSYISQLADDIGNMDNNSVNETPFLSRAKQGFRPPLQHSHRHILPHNWVGPGRSTPPKTRSDATATAPMSAAITHTGTKTVAHIMIIEGYAPCVWHHVRKRIDFRCR